MFKIEGDSIYLTRGDTLKVTVGMWTDETQTEEYVPISGDSLRFYLKTYRYKRDKSDYYEDEPLITKVIPIDTQILKLEPEDTKPLPVGDYVYDIELTKVDGTVDTFINNAPFKLVYEVG